MSEGNRSRLSPTQRTDIWGRWKSGQSLHASSLGPILNMSGVPPTPPSRLALRVPSAGNLLDHGDDGQQNFLYSARMQPSLIFQALVLLALANGTPVIAKGILGGRFATPIDTGVKFIDGRPILGSSKTVRGIFLSILVTSAFAPVVGLGWRIGALVATVAMAGDLFSSFLKRRINLPAGGKATGLDQVPESLFPLLACRGELSLTALDILAAVTVFFVGEMILSRLLYHLHLRDRPY